MSNLSISDIKALRDYSVEQKNFWDHLIDTNERLTLEDLSNLKNEEERLNFWYGQIDKFEEMMMDGINKLV